MSHAANRKSLPLPPAERSLAQYPDPCIDFRALTAFASAPDDQALPAYPRNLGEQLSELKGGRELRSSHSPDRGPSGEVDFGADDAIPGDSSTTVAVPVDGFVTGFIDPVGDKDWFALNVVAGETYLVSLRGLGASLFDPLLVLYDSTGAVVSSDDDGGFEFNSLLTFTASYTGVYYAEAGEPGHGITGEYRLDLRQQGEDVPDTSIVEILPNDVTFAFIDFDDPAPNLTEWDSYRFEAKPGFAYAITVAGGTDYLTDPSSLPAGELDPYLEVYGPDGMVVKIMDDMYFDDLRSRVSFVAEDGGTYYLALTAWDALKSGRPGIGGYSITVEEIDLAAANPLDTIDWGGKAVDTNHIKVYFAPAGDDFDPYTALGWSDYQIGQTMEALGLFGEFADLTFEITEDRDSATFKLVTVHDDRFSGAFIIDLGEGFFSVDDPSWISPGALEQGGRAFFTLLHEFGHGLGLAHPHDHYGPSEIMPGVDWPYYQHGVYDLNQGVHTMMSYNSNWWTHPDFDPFAAPVFESGWIGTPAPLDIALLQQKYGANTTHNKGNNVYILPTANALGTFYSTIWDTGGTDEIVHHGSADALIDLTAATLDYSATGGGVVSFVDGVFGGFTIANGVVVENASGGGGNDVLVGNDAANRLTGNGGDDVLLGGKGADILNGGAGKDTVSYSNATVGVTASLGSDRGTGGAAAGDRYTGIETLEGSKFADTLQGGNRDDALSGLDGKDRLSGGNGKDELLGGAGEDLLDGGNHNDVLDGGDGNDRLDGGNHRDTLLGGAGGDLLDGGNDDDVLDGGEGDDRLDGGNGRDHFIFADLGGADRIGDFRRGQDKIDLSELDAILGTPERDSFSWIGSSAFSGAAGELRAYRQGHDYFLAGDVDGDAIPDFLIETDILIARSDIIFG
jgi:Ca2+-binding RTX toxin-like protein